MGCVWALFWKLFSASQILMSLDKCVTDYCDTDPCFSSDVNLHNYHFYIFMSQSVYSLTQMSTMYQFNTSVHQSKMISTLAARCTPCDPVYNSASDDCKDGSDDTPSHLSNWYILSCKKASRLVLGSRHWPIQFNGTYTLPWFTVFVSVRERVCAF